MKKRGISPLIATVLLIGFTIVLAALVMKWGGTLFRTQTEQTSATTELEMVCSADIYLGLKNSCFVGNKINLYLSNEASTPINGLISSVFDTNNKPYTSEIIDNLNPFEAKGIKVDYSGGLPSQVARVQIFPKITIDNEQKICKDQVFPLSNLKSCIESTSSLVSSFENNYVDSTGKNNAGVPNGNVNFVDGIIGRGIRFSGDCSNITYNDDNSLDLTDNFTIDFWFKINGAPGGIPPWNDYHDLLLKQNTYSILFHYTGTKFILIQFPGGQNWFTRVGGSNGLENYKENDWNHLVLVFDINKQPTALKLYLNGKLEELWDKTNSVPATLEPLILGSSGGTYCANADIDELQILKESIE